MDTKVELIKLIGFHFFVTGLWGICATHWIGAPIYKANRNQVDLQYQRFNLGERKIPKSEGKMALAKILVLIALLSLCQARKPRPGEMQ